MAREKLFRKLPIEVENERTPHRRFRAFAMKTLAVTPAELADREREWNERASERKHATHKRPKRRRTA